MSSFFNPTYWLNLLSSNKCFAQSTIILGESRGSIEALPVKMQRNPTGSGRWRNAILTLYEWQMNVNDSLKVQNKFIFEKY